MRYVVAGKTAVETLLERRDIGAGDGAHTADDGAQVDGVGVVSSVYLAFTPLAFGSAASSTRVKRMRIGTAMASPKAIASPFPIDEMKLVVEIDESGSPNG